MPGAGARIVRPKLSYLYADGDSPAKAGHYY